MSRVSTPIFPDRKRGPREAIHPWGHSRVIPRKVPCPLSPSRSSPFPRPHTSFQPQKSSGRQAGATAHPLYRGVQSLTPSHRARSGSWSSTLGWESWASAPSSPLGGCSLSNASCGFQFTTSHFRPRRENKGTERLSDEPEDTQLRGHRAKTQSWVFSLQNHVLFVQPCRGTHWVLGTRLGG